MLLVLVTCQLMWLWRLLNGNVMSSIKREVSSVNEMLMHLLNEELIIMIDRLWRAPRAKHWVWSLILNLETWIWYRRRWALLYLYIGKCRLDKLLFRLLSSSLLFINATYIILCAGLSRCIHPVYSNRDIILKTVSNRWWLSHQPFFFSFLHCHWRWFILRMSWLLLWKKVWSSLMRII